MVHSHRFLPVHLMDWEKIHEKETKAKETLILVLGPLCGVLNTVGSGFYAHKNYNAGSACFNAGCTISALIGIRDLRNLKANKEKWARTENVDVFSMVLGVSASLMFSVGVTFYYPAVAAHTGSVGYWVGGFLFIVGCWFFMVGLTMTSGRARIVAPTGEVLGLPENVVKMAPQPSSSLSSSFAASWGSSPCFSSLWGAFSSFPKPPSCRISKSAVGCLSLAVPSAL